MLDLSMLSSVLQSLLDLLEILLVVTALWIIASDGVKQIINVYRIQSLLLAFVTVSAAASELVQKSSLIDVADVGLIVLIALLPLSLFISIKPLLVRATLSQSNPSMSEDLKMLLAGILGQFMPSLDRSKRFRIRHDKYLAQERDAAAVWVSRRGAPSGQRVQVVFPVLLLVAFLVPWLILTNPAATSTSGFTHSESIGLAVSLALHLMGLYNMTLPQRDIISQVVGLLVMDHGLYLAVVKIVTVPRPADFFVISLYFYTAITVFILVFLLPELRRQTGSIERATIAETSPLKDV